MVGGSFCDLEKTVRIWGDSESRCPPTPGHTRNSPTGVWAHLGQGKGHFTNIHELQASDKHQSGFPRGGHEIKTHFR